MLTLLCRHTLGGHVGAPKAETSPFVCTNRVQVARTASKLVHMRQIFVHFYAVAGTVYKSSTHDAVLKIEVILSWRHHARIDHVRYINILPWLRNVQVKIVIFSKFLLSLNF